ncbi:MAG: T9SS type A sorting domain-containing protein, partial [Bacteroidota bacterium]
ATGTTAVAARVYLYENANLTISTGAVLEIDANEQTFLRNDGILNNFGDLLIGQNVGHSLVQVDGLANFGEFFNHPAARLLIDHIGDDGLANRTTGIFTNYGEIRIGSVGTVSDAGIENKGIFYNEGGSIIIEDVLNRGIINITNGHFENRTAGLIQIGLIGDVVAFEGLLNTDTGSSFINDGLIQIDNTGTTGLTGRLSTTFNNTSNGQIEIGLSFGNIGSQALLNTAAFTNESGGSINIGSSTIEGLLNFTDGVFVNEAGASIFCTTDVVNNGTSMTNNGSLETEADFTNLGGILDGSGSVGIDGDWINSSTVNYTGLVVFYGSSNSEISGINPTTFTDLAIDKTAGELLLNLATQVDGDLLMINNNLDLNGQDLTLGSNGTIIGESGNAYIFGTLGGEIVKTVALSQPAAENPGNIGVEISSLADLGNTTIRRGHQAQLVNGNPGILRYYDISPTNNSGLDATILFYYLDPELNGNAENELAASRFNGNFWEVNVVDSAYVNLDFVATSGVDAFSTWTLSADRALPVELVQFNAYLKPDRTVWLSWETATEIDNDYFIVEHSKDGINFQEINRVQGAGTSYTTLNYEVIDVQPLSGDNYYRLKQVDFDGAFEYSEIQVVRLLDLGVDLSIFPNPATEVVHLDVSSGYKEAIIQVFDLAGRQVFEEQVIDGEVLNPIYVDKWAAGQYLIQLAIDRTVFTKKLSVIKD